MSAAHNAAVKRHQLARKQRVRNYEKIIATLAIRPLEVREMAELVHVEHSTARKYYLAMLRAGVIQLMSVKNGVKHYSPSYVRAGNDETVERFIAFVTACETTDQELGHQPRRIVQGEIGALGTRVIVKKKAEQQGMERHWLDVCLFGEKGMAREVT